MTSGEAEGQARDLWLPALFGDDMIVQREQPIRVWGRAQQGSVVQVRLAESSGTTVASDDGRWSLELEPLEAGGPHELVVEAAADTVRYRNVLVGDVWVAGGQSNMEWPLTETSGGAAAIAGANHPEIRLFTVERGFEDRPAEDVRSSGWHATTPQTIRNFSAVAYYFGKRLHEEVGVPIGLLESNWGGSAAEAWMTPDHLAAVAGFEAQADSMLNGALGPAAIYEREREVFDANFARWNETLRARDAGFEGAEATWARPDFDATDWQTMNVPGPWEDAGLADYDGIVWMRRTFEVPSEWLGRPLSLSFGTVDDADSTWINGRVVGYGSTYGPRSYTVPADVVRDGKNVIVVRILDTGGPGGLLGSADDTFIRPADDATAAPLSLSGEWSYRASIPLRDAPRLLYARSQIHIPSGLYNAMIAPLTPFAVKGVIWYQGETNADRAYQYRTLFPRLISNWREAFGQPEMPFLFVQLANFMAPQRDPDETSAWAELREAQALTLAVPHTAMAVTIDIGEANDIHPRNKRDVGERLALAALGTVYERDVVYSGPTFVGVRRDGSCMRLLFNHAGSGLVARDGALRGFTIAGPEGRFVWADARIEGNAVLVCHPEIQDPRAVRYGWGNNPSVNLYNREGLPASPFRTDDLPGVTGPR